MQGCGQFNTPMATAGELILIGQLADCFVTGVIVVTAKQIAGVEVNHSIDRSRSSEMMPDPGRIELFGRENPQFPCPERLVKSRPKKVAWIVAWNYREIRENFGESRDNASETPKNNETRDWRWFQRF